MTTRCRQSRGEVTFGTGKAGLLSAVVIAATAYWSSPTPAFAAPIPYGLIGGASFGTHLNDFFFGVFDYDPATIAGDVTNPFIIVSGTVDSGAFTIFNNSTALGFSLSSSDPFTGSSSDPFTGPISFYFDSPLGNSPDPLTSVVLATINPSGLTAVAVEGEAFPLAAPAPLLGSGLSGLVSGLAVALFLLTGRAKLRWRQA